MFELLKELHEKLDKQNAALKGLAEVAVEHTKVLKKQNKVMGNLVENQRVLIAGLKNIDCSLERLERVVGAGDE